MGERGHNVPGTKSSEAPKVPKMWQVPSSIQYICPLKPEVRTWGGARLVSCPGAISTPLTQ